ncbi:hypothetical protein BK737_04970 [Bacillus thuringiensis serovar palmanyolensis]|nr:hypothetical protein BK737_04970 [Bacillus thuringiensis serovar palmanyolensis]
MFRREFLVAVLELNTWLLLHGEIFPCHQFVGEEEYSMRNIWDGIRKAEIQSQFKESNCYSKPEYQEC